MPTHCNILQHTHTVTHTDPSGGNTHLIDFPCTCTPVRLEYTRAHKGYVIRRDVRVAVTQHTATRCYTLANENDTRIYKAGGLFCGLLIDPCVIRLMLCGALLIHIGARAKNSVAR